ncbi:MAG TPA: hypothetical protein VG122_20280 [Gemmata sp.]|nr:hypothetical protein [Gemmata sp.]
MLRPVLFAAAVVALVAPVRAADPDISGNWLLTYSQRGGMDQALAIIKVEMKDGKPIASTVYTPFKGLELAVTGFEVGNGKTIKFNTSVGWSFEGTLEADGKTAVGSLGVDVAPNRGKLTRTDKTELTQAETIIRTEPPTPVAESQKLVIAAGSLRNQAIREKDADKKKELTEKADAAQKELDEKQPSLLREVAAKHADTPFGLDAAADLLRGAGKFKVSPAEAEQLFAVVEKAATPYGTRYTHAITGQILDVLARQKGMETVAVAVAERMSKAFTDNDSPAYQSQILSAYKTALESSSVSNKDATLKTVNATLIKLEAKIDAEYIKTVPPFKPTAFAGRKDKASNQVVVMELFTGAQCPPCVAADVAFDALQKSYKPTDLVLIQYHLHIPGPDPLTNQDTVARAKFYSVNSTPTTLFNGKSQAPGGGGMANAEGKFKQYTSIIDPLLEKTADVKVAGKATRKGDKVDIAVEVAGADGDEMKLRLLVVEETIKYVGGNQLRFHHQVVRAMPDGADGVAIKDKTFKHTAAVDLVDVRKGLTKYLDDFAATRPFPKPERPMDLKSLRVIALVQNDKTKEIVQTLQIEIEGKPATGAGGE